MPLEDFTLNEIILIAETADLIRTNGGREMLTDLLDRVRDQRTAVNTAHRRHVRELERGRS